MASQAPIYPRMNLLHQLCFIFTIAALAWPLAGCEGRGSLARDGVSPVAGLPLAAPAQALALLEARGASAAGQTKTGGQYETALASNHIAINGSSLDFAPAWDAAGSPVFGDLAYAIYLFDGAGQTSPNTITSIWSITPVGTDVWVGLANFALDRWDWFQPGVAAPLQLAEMVPYVDPEDSRVLVAYVLTGTAVCTLDSVTLGEYVPELPLPVTPLAPLPMGGYGLAGPVLVDGNPALVYIEDFGGATRLIFMRAMDPDGTAWNAPVVIAAGATGYPGLALIGGQPAVSYQVAEGGPLAYCRSSNAQGTAWGAPVDVDAATPGAGGVSELLDIGGHPAIAYLASGMDANSQPALYIRADDATGAAWTATPLVLNPEYIDGKQARYMSFAVIAGNPAVAYNWVSVGPAGVSYVRATDATGSAWGAPASIPNTGYDTLNMLRNVDLVDLGGLPGVAYFIENFGVPANSAVYFADAQDAAGVTWDLPQTVLSAPPGEDPVNFGSLHVLTRQDSTQRAIVVATRDGSVLNDRADMFIATVPPAGGADFASGAKHAIARFQLGKAASGAKSASCYDSVDTIGAMLLLLMVGGDEYVKLAAAMQGYDIGTALMGVSTTGATVPADNF